MLIRWIKKIPGKTRSFGRDETGTVLVIAAICLVAIFTAAGAAIDYSRIASKKSKMANALDSAVLAAGIELSRGETSPGRLRTVFENFFVANLNGVNEDPTQFNIASFSISTDSGAISAIVETDVTAGLMRLAGFDNLNVTAEATTVFDSSDVEVVMMLDVTGSMRGSKLDDLKAAAKDTVNILIPDQNTRGVRIGLVPYASSVNVGRQLSHLVTSGNNSGATASLSPSMSTGWNVPTDDCVTERSGPDASTDASYRTAPLGSDARTVNAARSALRCPAYAQIQPLTDDRNDLNAQIDRYIAHGFTAGHIGVAWSYYLLSENWRDAFSAGHQPAAYSDNVKKIAILMTDGEFNTAFAGISGNPFGENAVASNQRARDLCEDMKRTKAGNPGIIVYSIAFKAPASAEATLRECANDDTGSTTYFYSAESGEDLRNAFRAIASSISNLRIAR